MSSVLRWQVCWWWWCLLLLIQLLTTKCITLATIINNPTTIVPIIYTTNTSTLSNDPASSTPSLLSTTNSSNLFSSCDNVTEFMCPSNGECKSNIYKCDQKKDCEDGFDELYCDQNKTCSDDEFKCDGGSRCITKLKRCDHTPDCKDGSDERDCNYTCRSDQFKCDHMCLPLNLRCNGLIECDDRSDEENCEGHLQGHFLQLLHDAPSPSIVMGSQSMAESGRCGPNQFDCNANDRKQAAVCIDEKDVCDDKFDCANHSDEPSACHKDHCLKAGNGTNCAHECISHKLTYECKCHLGFRQSPLDHHLCLDSDECAEIEGFCSKHKCHNLPDGHGAKCECATGFISIKTSDSIRCRLQHPESAQLLITDNQLLRSTSAFHNTGLHRTFATADYRTLFNRLDGGGRIAYGIDHNLIIWIDGGRLLAGRLTNQTDSPEIVMVSKNESNSFDLIKTISNSTDVFMLMEGIHFTDIAFDHVNELLYFVNRTGRSIEVLSVRNIHQRHTIVRQGLDEPDAMALCVEERFLVWTDWGSVPKIERIDQDGSNRLTLVQGQHLIKPIAITLDPIGRLIYWADENLHTISSIDFDAKSKPLPVFSHRVQLLIPKSLDLLADRLYWADGESHTIFSIDRFNSNGGAVEIVRVPNVVTVRVLHESRQTFLQPSPCSSLDCKYICLPGTSSANSSTCVCPDGHDWQTNAQGTLDCLPMMMDQTENSKEQSKNDHNINAKKDTTAAMAAQSGRMMFVAVVLIISSIIFIVMAFFVLTAYFGKNSRQMRFGSGIYRKTTLDKNSLTCKKYSFDRSQAVPTTTTTMPDVSEPLTGITLPTNDFV